MILDEVEILSNRVQPVFHPRPILSTIDTYDQLTQIDYPFNAPHVGRRPGWNVPSIAVTNESVNTIRSSVATRFVSPSIPTPAGIFPNPVVNPPPAGSPPVFTPVPNMQQSLKVDSAVHITFFISIFTATVPDFVSFAIFRDNLQISQIFENTTSSTASATTVTGAYTDTKATFARHLYELRWSGGASQVKAFFKHRTFQVSNLRAL
jgi:hypothetical protein